MKFNKIPKGFDKKGSKASRNKTLTKGAGEEAKIENIP